MSDSPLPRAVALIHKGIAQHLHIGAQLYVSRHGNALADVALGECRAGIPMTTGTLMLWLSAGKPLTSVAVARLWEAGRLDLDDRVAQFIPEFAAHGKETVTIRHLLTHTSGLRLIASNWSRAPWDQIITRICASPLERDWIPGQKAGYNAGSSWFILGEIVRRLDGRPVGQVVREDILLPIGATDTWMGMPPDVFRAYGPRIGLMHMTLDHPAHPHPHPHLNWDTEAAAALCRPGANVRGPIRDLGRFYEVLLNRGRALHGRRILRPQTIEAMTARQRTGMFDHTFRQVMDWGLGFLLNSAIYGKETPYGYGPYASPRTFGHGGSQSSGGYADPEHGLVVAFVFNGTPGEERHQQRLRALNAAIYEDLGLAPPAPRK